MADGGIDDYLAGLDEPKRSTLEELRRTIARIIPDAEECISYGMPGFRVKGEVVAGFAAFKNNLSYLPHSGSVLAGMADQLGEYTRTPGSLHFPADRPLPSALVEQLITARLRESASRRSPRSG